LNNRALEISEQIKLTVTVTGLYNYFELSGETTYLSLT
jgi:hypothetical protein